MYISGHFEKEIVLKNMFLSSPVSNAETIAVMLYQFISIRSTIPTKKRFLIFLS